MLMTMRYGLILIIPNTFTLGVMAASTRVGIEAIPGVIYAIYQLPSFIESNPTTSSRFITYAEERKITTAFVVPHGQPMYTA